MSATPDLGCQLSHEQRSSLRGARNDLLDVHHADRNIAENILVAWCRDFDSHCISIQKNQVFQCPFIEVNTYCCWLIHIYNDKRFALTSSPLQRVYYWNANSTIAVMTLFYNAHISGTFANGFKKTEQLNYAANIIWMCHHTLSSNFISKSDVIWNFAVTIQKERLGGKKVQY